MSDEKLEDLEAVNADEITGAGAAIPPPPNGPRLPRMQVNDPGVHVDMAEIDPPKGEKLRGVARGAAEEILPDPR